MTDQEDYELFIAEKGLSDSVVKETMESNSNLINYIDERLELKKSSREGLGIFTNCNVPSGEVFLAGTQGKVIDVTLVGRYTNHSKEPNCIPVVSPIGFLFITIIDLIANEELTVNYRHVAKVSNV